MMTMDERKQNLTMTVGDAAAVDHMRQMVNSHEWRYAKTMPGVPHEYSLKWTWGRDEFRQAVNFIWENGVDAYFGRKTTSKRYWFDHESGWYYFVDPSDIAEGGYVTKTCQCINRARIDRYIFWESTDLIGTILKCRVKYANETKE